jgi:hypothetical protein
VAETPPSAGMDTKYKAPLSPPSCVGWLAGMSNFLTFLTFFCFVLHFRSLTSNLADIYIECELLVEHKKGVSMAKKVAGSRNSRLKVW